MVLKNTHITTGDQTINKKPITYLNEGEEKKTNPIVQRIWYCCVYRVESYSCGIALLYFQVSGIVGFKELRQQLTRRFFFLRCTEERLKVAFPTTRYVLSTAFFTVVVVAAVRILKIELSS